MMSSVKGGEEEIRQEGRTGGGRELRSMKAEGRRREGGRNARRSKKEDTTLKFRVKLKKKTACIELIVLYTSNYQLYAVLQGRWDKTGV